MVIAVIRADRVDRVDWAGGVFKRAIGGERAFRLATAIGWFGFDGEESGSSGIGACSCLHVLSGVLARIVGFG